MVAEKTLQIKGVGIGKGCAVGKLYFVRNASKKLSQTGEPSFWTAIRNAREKLDRMFDKAQQTVGHTNAEIFEVYRMMLEDEDFLNGCVEKIRSGKPVSDAVTEQSRTMAEEFRRLDDEYLSARADDIAGLAGIINQSLGESESINPPPGSIIAAQDLTPYQTVMIDREQVNGFVTFGGSVTSHTAILARALGIPALVRVVRLGEDCNGCTAIIDAENGILTVNPSAEQLKTAKSRIDKSENEKPKADKVSPVTKSGKHILTYANVGSADEAETARRYGAEGIGLMRTELIFLNRSAAPSEDEQLEIYKRTAEAIGGLTVIRTLDIGADKQPAFLRLEREDNPSLGVRGIRLSQLREDLFVTQIRAVLRASAFGKIAVMFPMVSNLSELLWARNIIDAEKNRLKSEKIGFDENLQIGIMIETPAAALTSDSLAEYADFFSVGSNDLCQYVYAADRQNSTAAAVIPECPDAVLKLIKASAESIHRYPGKWLGVCGELASNPNLTEKLIIAGADELSMSPVCIPEIAEKISII